MHSAMRRQLQALRCRSRRLLLVQHGFTTLELLAAMLILSTGIMALVGTLDSSRELTSQSELTRTMGIEWAPANEHGHREIAGIPDQVIRHFSKRRADIEEALAERAEQGLPTGTRAADVVAHETRAGRRR